MKLQANSALFKMKPKKTERRRSTHLELLGGVPADTLRTIREVAQRADLPLERVFRDILAIGVSVVSDAQESPYQSLIAFRAGLADKQAHAQDAHAFTRNIETATGGELAERTLGGGALLTLDPQGLTVPDAEGLAQRLDHAFERSGQLSSDETDPGLSIAQG